MDVTIFHSDLNIAIYFTEGVAPQILIHPQSLTHVLTGVTFVLSCQAMGHPVPEVKWFKDGHSLDKNNTRVSEFSSGRYYLQT